MKKIKSIVLASLICLIIGGCGNQTINSEDAIEESTITEEDEIDSFVENDEFIDVEAYDNVESVDDIDYSEDELYDDTEEYYDVEAYDDVDSNDLDDVEGVETVGEVTDEDLDSLLSILMEEELDDDLAVEEGNNTTNKIGAVDLYSFKPGETMRGSTPVFITNVRAGAGYSYDVIAHTHSGESFEILDMEEADGYAWYKITIQNKEGYIRADLVEIE